MAKQKRSQYKSSKSVAKNKTVPIAADDPRAARNKIAQTIARQGAEVEIVGLNGVSLAAGGSNVFNPKGFSGIDSKAGNPRSFVVPGPDGQPISFGFGKIVLADITNVSTAWSDGGSGEDLIVTFDWDYADPANQSVTEFVLEVTADGITRQTPFGSFPVNRTQTSQTATLTRTINELTLGNWRTSITSVCVYAMDAFYNKSTSVCDTSVPAWILDLPVPVITVTAANNGYNVGYTIPTQSVFDAIDIVEYESNASTEPTGVTYSRVYFDNISPANIITTNTNSRWVKARFSSDAGVYTAFSAAQKVTPTDPITVDTVGPGNVATVTTSGGIDPTDYLGFNGYADISWSQVTGNGIRGYRIRFKPTTSSVYSYADSPGAALSYRLTGLAVGVTYNIEVATYDQYNNTSTQYVAGSNVSIPGTPIMNGFITAGEFKFGDGVVTGKRGLYFNDSNYWYINSSSTAEFKLGGPTSNYISWDGAELKVNGNLGVDGSTKIGGNIELTTSGASIYNGTINLNGNLTGNGFALNSDGLKVAMGSNSVTIDAASGSIIANAGNIGGWIITSNEISKTQTNEGKISLNSLEGYIAITNDGIANKTAGINSPALSGDVVFWSGGTGSPDPLAPFTVTLEGELKATSAIIRGEVKALSGGFGTFDPITEEIVDGWEITTNGIIAAGVGRIKLGNYSIKSNQSSDFTIFDDVSLTTVIETNTSSNATTDNQRIFVGSQSRQVEVRKSAGVWGDGTIATESAGNSTDKQQYRSGGLRNMFTVTKGNIHQDPDGTVNDFPDAIKGDLLIVWDTATGGTGKWKKIDAIYLKAVANAEFAPVNTINPVVSPSNGTPGSTTFTCTSGTWTGSPTPTITYQWKYFNSTTLSWTSLSGQTLPTYSPPSNYFSVYGSQLRCDVTATNPSGSTTASAPASFSSVPAFDGSFSPNPAAYATETEATIVFSGTNTQSWRISRSGYGVIASGNGSADSIYDPGLTPSTLYTYTVVLYAGLNQTGTSVSGNVSVTTQSTTPPTPPGYPPVTPPTPPTPPPTNYPPTPPPPTGYPPVAPPPPVTPPPPPVSYAPPVAPPPPPPTPPPPPPTPPIATPPTPPPVVPPPPPVSYAPPVAPPPPPVAPPPPPPTYSSLRFKHSFIDVNNISE